MVELAEGQHGLVARWQLRERGMGRGAIDARIARGRLHPVHRGVYRVGHRLLASEGRWMAAVLACGSGAAVSHRTAGQLWGIVPMSTAMPEVTRPRRFSPRPGIIAHCAVLPEDEVEIEDGIPATAVSRTVLDLASLCPARQLERAWNEMEVRQLTSRVSVPELMKRYPGRRGTVALRRLCGSREPGGVTRNDFEEAFVALLDRHALPRPRLNADLALRGRFVEVDCLWRRQRLALELDGRAVHARERAFESDRRRDRLLLVEGWRPARVTWRQLRDEPEAVAADLVELLGIAAARPCTGRAG